MESKVMLYDADNKKIGETFLRRARQLVKQQRAEWTDDSQSAIKFAPDVEDWEAIGASDEEATHATTVDPNDVRLIALAEKRIKERKRFIIHSIMCIPVWLVLFSTSVEITRNLAIPMFFTGVCLTAYLIHAYQFAIARISKYRSHDREERKARRLAAEIAILKAELQR